MPKEQITVTIEAELINRLDTMTSDGKYRNRSHVIEYLLNKAIEQEKPKDHTSA